SNTEKIEMLKNFANNDNIKSGIEQIEELIGYLDESNAVFNIGLARGLSYYTDTVFEVFLTNEVIKKTDGEEITFSSSLCGGGRYNKIIGDYIGGGKEFPATGISFGIEPIIEVMKLLGKFEMNPSTTTVFIIPIQTQKECVKIAEQIRSAGINCDLDIMGRGISKNLGFANSNKIPYVVFAGPDEIKQNKVKLRDMVTGEEEMLSLKEVCEKLK
ncbi:hypothetical protein HON01_05335, partial [Candidatus Woesearchaeota archaeon]|nr:hypothetical protein [Candidatus Woesearchaeota archaeon]